MLRKDIVVFSNIKGESKFGIEYHEDYFRKLQLNRFPLIDSS